ncbi:hypothetical protein ACSBR2_015256 [Camellia fascicularis]
MTYLCISIGLSFEFYSLFGLTLLTHLEFDLTGYFGYFSVICSVWQFEFRSSSPASVQPPQFTALVCSLDESPHLGGWGHADVKEEILSISRGLINFAMGDRKMTVYPHRRGCSTAANWVLLL